MSEDKKDDHQPGKDYKAVNINDSLANSYKNELSKIRNTVSESEELLIDINPISQYNFFVRNYNLSYNKIRNQDLSELQGERSFIRMYWIQSKWWMFVLLNMIIPPIIVIINNFVVVKAAWGTIIVIYYVVLSGINVFSYYLWEEARIVFMKNRVKVPNPFERMVYNPTICKNNNVCNDHFEVDIECKVFLKYSVGDVES